MKIEVIDTYDDFSGLRRRWELLYSVDPEAQFFLSWTWLSHLFLRRPDSWRILAIRPEGNSSEYVAFLPLRPTTRFSKSQGQYVNELLMAGNYWADCTGLICHPDFENEAIPALAEYLLSMHWAKLTFENLRASTRRTALLMEPFRSEELKVSNRNRKSEADGINNLITPVVELPQTYDEYLQSRLSTNTRQKVRRFQRKLDASSNLKIVESDPRTRDEDLDTLLGYWRDRWAERKGAGIDTLVAKTRRILQQGLDANIVYLPILRENDRPVAGHASFVDREKRTLLFYHACRDETWRTLPAGLILHSHTIRWAIDNGLQTYELLRGDEQYKYSLGAVERRIKCIRVGNPNGINRHGRLDAGSFDFIQGDLGHRLQSVTNEQKKRICEQILNSWPNDDAVLRRAEELLIEAGDVESARDISARRAEIGLPQT